MGVRPTFLISAAFAAGCRMLAAGEQIPPTVSITAPAARSILSGVVVVAADATDDYGVAGVQFQVDGNAVGFEDTDAPHAVNWSSFAR